MAEFDNKTCARLEVQEELHDLAVKKMLFVKSVWEPATSSPTSFSLAITDGQEAWTFEGSEAFVNEMAQTWDKTVSWVMEKLKFYLCVGQPGVTYLLTRAQGIDRKLSFEIQDEDTNPGVSTNILLSSASAGVVTRDLLEFLLHGNEKLTSEYSKTCRMFYLLEARNEALLQKIEHHKNEKVLFQQDIIPKLTRVINTKKRKLRELKERYYNESMHLKNKSRIEEKDATSSSSDD